MQGYLFDISALILQGAPTPSEIELAKALTECMNNRFYSIDDVTFDEAVRNVTLRQKAQVENNVYLSRQQKEVKKQSIDREMELLKEKCKLYFENKGCLRIRLF